MLTVPASTETLVRRQEGGGWHGASVLVTGATGFIGAHLVRRLGALGARVHAVSRSPRERTGPGETWHVADVSDPEAIENLLLSTRPAVVFHLASEVAGARDPRLVRPMLGATSPAWSTC